MNAPEALTHRFYLKCRDCLTVVAVETERYPQQVECGVCGGRTWVMGEVGRRHRLVQHTTECACDERCASATGPKCECACGGKHHGEHVLVELVRDVGPVPRVTPKGDTTKALARAEEYRSAVAEAQARINVKWGDVIAHKSSGGWLSGADFNKYQDAGHELDALRHARKLRSHKGRMNALSQVAV